MRAANGLDACFGKAEMLDLTFVNQILHRSRYFFDGHVRVNSMLIEQIDDLDLEPLERALDCRLDLLRPAVQARSTGHSAGIETRGQVEPEFGGDDYLLAERSEGFAHKFLVQERAVDLGGVEKRDAAFHGGPQKFCHLPLVFGRAVGKAHPHAAEPESRNLQVALSKFALLHSIAPSETVSLFSRLEQRTPEAAS